MRNPLILSTNSLVVHFFFDVCRCVSLKSNGIFRIFGISGKREREMSSRDGHLFAVIVPGRPILTNFRRKDMSKFETEIARPGSVSEICFVLLRPDLLSPSQGLNIYCTVRSTDEWRLIGVITRDCPSKIIRTGWTSIFMKNMPIVRIGVSVEPLREVKNAHRVISMEQERKNNYPVKIAENLYSYLSSFIRKDPTSGVDHFVVPVNALRSWVAKIKRKLSLDPSFLFQREN